MTIRFLHLADLHLGARFGHLGPHADQRRQDLFDAFRRAVDFAVDDGNRIDAVLVAGDAFDASTPEPALVGQVKAQTARLAEAHLPVFWIPGTHDRFDDPDCVYRQGAFPGVTLLTGAQYGTPHEAVLQGQAVAVSGYAWQQHISSQHPLAHLPDLGPDVLHVALFHGSVLNAGLGYTVKDHYVPITPEQVAAAPVQYLAMGHYHNPRQWPTARGIAYYPGTLEGRKFGENGERHLTVVEFGAPSAPPRLETHITNQRTLLDETLNLDLGGFEDSGAVAAWIRSRAGAHTLLRVTLTGTPAWDVNADALHAETVSDCFHLEIRDRTDAFNSAWVADFAAERSVRGEFVRRLRAKLEDAAPEERPTLALALRLGVHAFARHDDAAD